MSSAGDNADGVDCAHQHANEKPGHDHTGYFRREAFKLASKTQQGAKHGVGDHQEAVAGEERGYRFDRRPHCRSGHTACVRRAHGPDHGNKR